MGKDKDKKKKQQKDESKRPPDFLVVTGNKTESLNIVGTGGESPAGSVDDLAFNVDDECPSGASVHVYRYSHSSTVQRETFLKDDNHS